jgi:acyl-coenzyme A synthetase/AMP-(fatty) acid ligase
MDWVIEKLSRYQNSIAFKLDDQTISYQQLCRQINECQAELIAQGLRPGDSVAIIGDYSPSLVALFIALLVNKNIVIPLTTETTRHHERFFDLASVVGCFKFENTNKTAVFIRRNPSRLHPLLESLKSGNEAGLVLFTSGSTGESKGAAIQASKLLNRFNTPVDHSKKKQTILVFLKLDHIGGINTLFSILMNGGTVVSEGDRTAKSVCSVIEKYQVELLPTTPTFLNMLLISGVERDHDLSSLKMITYGTEPMPQSTLKAMNSTFPNVKLKQTYGLTELGIFSTQSKDSTSDWVKIGGQGVELKVIDHILYIKTESAMLGYLNAPSPFSDEGWYETGDRVEVDGEYFRILGRESEIINVGGEKVYPAEVESVLLEIDNVREALVQGKSSPVTGQIVVARLVLNNPENTIELQKRITKICNEKLEPFKVPKLIMASEKSFVSDRFKKARNM